MTVQGPTAIREAARLLQDSRMTVALAGAEVLPVAGTSCQVVPAAYIPCQVKANGGKVIELNREPTLGSLAAVILAEGFSSAMVQLLAVLPE